MTRALVALRRTGLGRWVLAGTLVLMLAGVVWGGEVEEGADWVARVRGEHPRVLVSGPMWEGVRERARGGLQEHFAALEGLVEEMPVSPEVRDWGHELMTAALVYRVTGEPAVLEKIEGMLESSLEHYRGSYERGEVVDWYAFSRIGWIAALDWVWNDLREEKRRRLAAGMLEHVRAFESTGRLIRGEAKSGPTEGFYGMQSAYWFAGLLLLGEGIDDAAAVDLLVRGRAQYQEMLEHREGIAGKEGGSAAGTLGYAIATYPFAEWNYLHSWKAAVGEDAAARWDYLAQFPAYIDWNWLPGGLEFGYGDAPHTSNQMPGNLLYLHMNHIVHFFGDTHRQAAARAAEIGERALAAGFSQSEKYWREGYPIHRYTIYPYLLDVERAGGADAEREASPLGRRFAAMGQMFIRSGRGEEDTYILISCGGKSANHRHYDSGHFTIYHRGFLALDSGTRLGESLPHLHNYYAQTIAHNCVLIDMPGEAPAPHWGRVPEMQAGGQYRHVASEVEAFQVERGFVYVRCDLTPVYRPEKCGLARREFVFIPPRHLVVFDRVIATEASYGKRWLLHTAEEPKREGEAWVAEQGAGRLTVWPVLPDGAEARAVGGAGKAFLVAGKNYAIREQDMVEGRVPELMGRWRLEVKPGAAREEDVFLHVLEMGEKGVEALAEPEVEVGEEGVAVRFVAGTKRVRLWLRTTGAGGGTLSMDGGEWVLE